ncbi:MAG: lysyl oxidase family protein [Bacteroidota bacterium]
MKSIFTTLILFLASINLYSQCAVGNVEVKIVLTTDNYASETTWQLKDKFGVVLLSNGTLTNATTFTSTLCVPNSGCLSFTINDSFNDGICCNYGTGSFQIYVNNVLQTNNTGQFGGSFTYYFNCPPGESCSSAITVGTGTFTAPGNEYYYSFKPTQLGLYTVSTCSLAGCDTKLWVYENCNGPFNTNNTGTILYNDDFCNLQSEVSGALDTSKTYIVRVGSYNNTCTGPITFAINYQGPISGCTTYSACNYNPLATIDDGSCVYYPSPFCTAPDLTIVQPQFISSLSLGTVNAGAGDCRVAESCLTGYGARTVINFDTYIKNIGTQDYFIGDPGNNPGQFTTNNCHGHAHYEGYAEYRLYKPGGQMIPIGFKNGFCVLDFDGCPDGGVAKFSCGQMGISKQCGDIYSAGLDCQWIDITDVDTGNYVMAAKVNWDQSADALGHFESNYTNNWAQACIRITANSSGQKNFVLLASCPSYSDCAGTQFGNAAVDCNGVCNGTAKMGDLNNSGTQQLVDGQLYVNKILNTTITPNSCNDLNNTGTITVWDAALMANCVNHGAGNNTKCLFPRGNLNPNQTATLSIGGFNLSQNYIDVYIKNPTSRIVGYEFTISGATILNVVNLVPASVYPEIPDFLVGGNKVICLSYKDSTIAKSTIAQPMCRVYYTNGSGNICVNSVVELVNKEYEAINKVVQSNCVLTTGVTQVADHNHYFSVVPNPASNEVQLTGFVKQGDNSLIEIKDIAGRLLFSEHVFLNEAFNHPLNFSEFKSGVYYITVSSKSGSATKPVVIVK